MQKNILTFMRLFSSKIGFSFGIFIFIIIFSLSMCKTSQDDKQFTLSVTTATGISGVPAMGSTIYLNDAEVNYNYQLETGYQNLIVKIDSIQSPSNGTIIMNKDHSLNVTAEVIVPSNFTLTVDVGTGITGTPSSGTKIVSENNSVSYNYQLETGYNNLIVSLDGVKVEDSGDIIMDKDHDLTAVAQEGYDITGDWDLVLTVNKTSANASIQETINVSLEFSGSMTSGNVIINGNNVGSYTVQNEVVSFIYNITDPTLGQLKYDYTGEFTANDTMGGDVIVYKITGTGSQVKAPMAEIAVKRGVWSGKRKKK